MCSYTIFEDLYFRALSFYPGKIHQSLNRELLSTSAWKADIPMLF